MPDTYYDQIRKAEFHELAQGILQRDRRSKTQGTRLDTAQLISRELEKAYQRGKKEEREGPPSVSAPKRSDAIAWSLIKSRPRAAFYSICLAVLGFPPNKKPHIDYGLWRRPNPRTGKPEWVLCWEIDGEIVQEKNHAWGDVSINYLINQGLLCSHLNQSHVMRISSIGAATWWEANEQSESEGYEFLVP